MPRYDFECQNCNKTIELQLTVGQYESDVGRFCADCGRGLVRVIAPVGFSLKGGGWAKDGYAKPVDK